MANRSTLHPRHIAEFTAFMERSGFYKADTKGAYEVLRFCGIRRKKTVTIYHRNGCDHLSVQERDMGYVNAFLRELNQKANPKK